MVEVTPARKAPNDTVVKLDSVVALHGFGVVVDYRPTPSPRYLIVRTDSLGRHPYGRPIWIESTEMTPTPRTSKRPAIIYRKNKKLEDRGCSCSCCYHVSGFLKE